MDIAAELDHLSPDDLRRRGSLKWTVPPPGHIGAFVAESDLPLAPVVTHAVDDAVGRGLTGYLPPSLEHRVGEACADFQRQRFGWEVDADRIRTLPDVLTALAFTATHLAPAHLPIVLPTPAYMPFLAQPAVLGRRLVTVPMDRVGGRHVLDPHRLERALDGGGLLVLVNPHNPTGQVATRAELSAVAEIVERTGSTVFADEIHAPLVYAGAQHVPYASLSEATARHTVTAVSASKGWNLPGLACAELIMTADEHLRAWDRSPMVARHGTSPLGATAACAAFSPDGVAHLDQVVDYLDRGRLAFADALREAAPQVGYVMPEATYIHWLDLRGLELDAADVTRRTTVLGTDGADCGTPGFLRLTLATSVPIVREIGRRMAGLVSR